ncbi:MAG: acetyl-CoA C-acetyltransferase [Porticoccaceae bacterium]|jgi:acetyl-CoA C-acetyltransferase|nr:acetyl-CoA C-acetyltransferase [Porticoccaceae bacterium]MEA3298634.1 acetyl-CoA C-acetyltransferase [Pseudomonadota bacterium]
MREVVIVGALRTAIGSFMGGLAGVPAQVLGATVIRALLDRHQVAADQVDEVILGQVLTAGHGQNPARQAAIAAGLPHATPAMGVSKVCGSGLKAVHLAAQAIMLGDADVVIAGGQESMSQAAHVLPEARTGLRMGDGATRDTMIVDGLTDAFGGYHMGVTAENLAALHGISREDQDIFAAHSQHKAEAAMAADRFRPEIAPVSIPQRRGDPLVVDRDEHPKPGVTAASLAALKPAFRADGTVTAGNASGINDGAAAVLMMSAKRADELGLTPLVRIQAYANAGVDPALMGQGPVPAVERCLARAGWTIADLDLIEANEAFAAQAIAVNRQLGWDTDRVNVNGGAIALGHPIGASGCRILVTLIHEMVRRDIRRGLATLCIGGGMGVALAVER